MSLKYKRRNLMMSGRKTKGATIIGKLTGFSKRWNPFSTEGFAMVEVDSKVINVPIDYRQIRLIQKEHPVDSMVPLAFNEGRWEIVSEMDTSDSKLISDRFGDNAFL
jgi:hypothetical protein